MSSHSKKNSLFKTWKNKYCGLKRLVGLWVEDIYVLLHQFIS